MSTSKLKLLAILALSVAASACAGGPQLPGLPVGAGLPDLTTGALASTESSFQPHTSAEIYSRIARGANACWFGPRGRIASTHMLHADADPSMNGGAVDLVVHERASDQPKPWGYKAYRVQLKESPGFDGTPGGGGTSIAVENARIADAEAARMRAEVFQWAAGIEGCKTDPALDKPVETAKSEPPPAKLTGKAAVKQTKAP